MPEWEDARWMGLIWKDVNKNKCDLIFKGEKMIYDIYETEMVTFRYSVDSQVMFVRKHQNISTNIEQQQRDMDIICILQRTIHNNNNKNNNNNNTVPIVYDILRRDGGPNVHGLAWTPPPTQRILPPPWTMVVRDMVVMVMVVMVTVVMVVKL